MIVIKIIIVYIKLHMQNIYNMNLTNKKKLQQKINWKKILRILKKVLKIKNNNTKHYKNKKQTKY